MADIRTEALTINMGPQHPSTHGVLRLVLTLDGETVLSAARVQEVHRTLLHVICDIVERAI